MKLYMVWDQNKEKKIVWKSKQYNGQNSRTKREVKEFYYIRVDLKQYKVHKVEKQFRPAKQEEMVTRPNKKSSSHNLRFVMAIQTHLSYDALQLCSNQQQHLLKQDVFQVFTLN